VRLRRSILAVVLSLLARTAGAQVPDSQPVGPALGTGEALFHVALEARRRGDERMASALLERVVRLDPGAVLPRLEWAEALLVLREPELVEALLVPVAERIEAESGFRPDAASRFYRLRGTAAARAGRSGDALDLYERAIDLSPRDLGLRSLVVSMYRTRGDRNAAARHLVAAAMLRPEDPDLRIEAGRALLAVARFGDAELEFRDALRVDLWAVPAWQGLGESLAGQERWADAEEVYRGGIQLAPESAQLHELLGDVLLAAGRVKEAVVWYTRASALPGANAPVLERKIEQARTRLEP
jgi:tetratricopeptide (TPR) repeat protein